MAHSPAPTSPACTGPNLRAEASVFGWSATYWGSLRPPGEGQDEGSKKQEVCFISPHLSPDHIACAVRLIASFGQGFDVSIDAVEEYFGETQEVLGESLTPGEPLQSGDTLIGTCRQ